MTAVVTATTVATAVAAAAAIAAAAAAGLEATEQPAKTALFAAIRTARTARRLAAARLAAGDPFLDAAADAAGHRDFDAVGHAHVDLAGNLAGNAVGDHAGVRFIVGFAHALVAGPLANFLAGFVGVAGHALRNRHAFAAAHHLFAGYFFPHLAAHPVTNGAGLVVTATGIAAGVAAATAGIAAVAVVTARTVHTLLEAADKRQLFAALPVTAIDAATLNRAHFLAGDAVLVAGPLFGVGNAHAHAASLFVALGDELAAGDAAGAGFRNAFRLVDGTGLFTALVLVAGLLDHVGFRNPLVASHGVVLLVAAAAVRALGRRNLLLGIVLRVFLLQIVCAKRKSQHGRHCPSQHRQTKLLPDHAFSLFV